MFYKYNTVPVYIGIVRYSTVLWSIKKVLTMQCQLSLQSRSPPVFISTAMSAGELDRLVSCQAMVKEKKEQEMVKNVEQESRLFKVSQVE